jgi:hypothetical protein
MKEQIGQIVGSPVLELESTAEKLGQIEKMIENLGDSQGAIYQGEEILLSPEVASKYPARIEPVEPCTCWRDGRPCGVCRDFAEGPGGWNGTLPRG